MIKSLATAFALAAFLLLPSIVATTALANEGPETNVTSAPIDPRDVASLQRGARLFVNYCLGCHSAQHMRYNRMISDLGLTDKSIVDNLILRGGVERDGTYSMDKVGETMKTTLDRADAKAIFGVVPPDLSVEARVRGNEWLYGYLRAFYRDDKQPTGWNNLVFPNVSMPHVLWELSGPTKLVVREFDTAESARGALLQTHVVGSLEAVHATGEAGASGHGNGSTRYIVRSVEHDSPGSTIAQSYDTAVLDLVNFLAYIAEPAKNERIQLGIKVLIFLSILFVFAYWAKREFWKDVH